MREITIHTTDCIFDVERAGFQAREYEKCSRSEATIKLTIKGRPDADAKLRQQTHYLREVTTWKI